MKALQYIKHPDFRKDNNPYNWEQGCYACKGKFEEDEKFIRIDVKVTYMRGDDEVYCFHKNDCFGVGLGMLEKEYGTTLRN